jgi:hypothetical protein
MLLVQKLHRQVRQSFAGQRLAFAGICALTLTMACNNYGLLDKLQNPGNSSGSNETFTSNYYVFVSSWTTLGHMGGSPYNDVCSSSTGADKADCACTRAAIARGLRKSSTHVFRAWLSLGPSTSDAKCRVQGLGSCTTILPGPWFNTQGQTVVNNFDSFTLGALTNPIRYDEFGVDQGPNLVWTNTGATGAAAGAVDCNDWTDNSGGFSGGIGDRTAAGTTWTQHSPDQTCNTSQRIYCVAAP